MARRKVSVNWPQVVAGVVVGALAILLIRLFSYHVPRPVHYHANFAVYINGQREEFKGPAYYEETTACTATGDSLTPAERAHMHDNVNDVVHVHDHAVTWEQFFNNLGWSVGKDFVESPSAMYQNNGSSVLHIMLNGQDLTGISSIANMVIKDEDRLLISYGDVSNDELQAEFKNVASTAHKYDVEKDPAACSGQTAKTTFKDRLHHLF